MLPDWRAYLLALTPVCISAVQLAVIFYTSDSNLALLADLICVAIVSFGLGSVKVEKFLAVLVWLSIGHVVLTSGFFILNPLGFIHRVVYYILFPYILALGYTRYGKDVYIKMGVLAALGLSALNLAVFPIELSMRGGIDYLQMMNFSGAAYELIAVLLLASALAKIGAVSVNGYLSIALIVTTILTFSRGALAVSLVVLALTWSRESVRLFSLRGFIALLLLVMGFGFFMSSQYFDIFENYWVGRLNFVSDDSIANNLESFQNLSGRDEVWSMGFQHIGAWPYTGTGIATVSSYFSEMTSGRYAFSSYHNLTITALAERGLFLGSLFLLLLLFILMRLTQVREWQAMVFFCGFLLFAHTTGAELIIHSPHVRNANITFYLFLLFICLKKHIPLRKLE